MCRHHVTFTTCESAKGFNQRSWSCDLIKLPLLAPSISGLLTFCSLCVSSLIMQHKLNTSVLARLVWKKTQDEPVDKDGSRAVSQLSATARPNCKDINLEERSNEEANGRIHESSAYGRSSEYGCCKAI